jgi:hypothetical protein
MLQFDSFSSKIYPISEPKDLPLPKDWQILVGEMEQDDHFFESEFSTLSPEGFIMIKVRGGWSND